MDGGGYPDHQAEPDRASVRSVQLHQSNLQKYDRAAPLLLCMWHPTKPRDRFQPEAEPEFEKDTPDYCLPALYHFRPPKVL